MDRQRIVPGPPRTAGPSVAARPCERFTRDGQRCTNRTENADRWCRLPGCHGFVRARHDVLEHVVTTPTGTRAHIANTGDLPVPISVGEAHEVDLTTRAVDSFRYHHGGSAAAAQAQLRAMLVDFLQVSARRRTTNGFWVLAREGYELVLGPDLASITGYATAHRDRVWAQVQAGIASRSPRRTNDRWRILVDDAARPAPGPPMEASALPAAVDPATVFLTSLALTSWNRLCQDRTAGMSDEEIVADLRAALADLASGRVQQLPQPAPTTPTRGAGLAGQPMVLIATDRNHWLVTADARVVVNVKTPRAS